MGGQGRARCSPNAVQLTQTLAGQAKSKQLFVRSYRQSAPPKNHVIAAHCAWCASVKAGGCGGRHSPLGGGWGGRRRGRAAWQLCSARPAPPAPPPLPRPITSLAAGCRTSRAFCERSVEGGGGRGEPAFQLLAALPPGPAPPSPPPPPLPAAVATAGGSMSPAA